jgi:hypothetical protein
MRITKLEIGYVKIGRTAATIAAGLAMILIACRSVRTDFSNWDQSCQLAIGDEIGGGRKWNGTVFALQRF